MICYDFSTFSTVKQGDGGCKQAAVPAQLFPKSPQLFQAVETAKNTGYTTHINKKQEEKHMKTNWMKALSTLLLALVLTAALAGTAFADYETGAFGIRS